ncbi:hypothetical protein K440DRAFT_199302 [Wilcoxina mikolae CBS 423.85]|nr:hypothetical protein K440DRAFT_199302 [Wilcoxina mikolae CBS 423.85]
MNIILQTDCLRNIHFSTPSVRLSMRDTRLLFLSVGYLKADVPSTPPRTTHALLESESLLSLTIALLSLVLLLFSWNRFSRSLTPPNQIHPDQEGNPLDVWAASISTGTPRHLRGYTD